MLLSFVLTRKPARLLAVSRQLSASYAEIGQPVTVQVAWSGSGSVVRDGCWCRIVCPPISVPSIPAAACSSPADSTTTYTYQVSGGQRGYHRIGPLTSPAATCSGWIRSPPRGRTAVISPFTRACSHPTVAHPLESSHRRSAFTKRIYEDATRIVGVRDYLPGDPLSKIHWKASAHSGELATKMCEPSSSVEVHMLLNLFHADYPEGGDEVELACTTAASISARLLWINKLSACRAMASICAPARTP